MSDYANFHRKLTKIISRKNITTLLTEFLQERELRRGVFAAPKLLRPFYLPKVFEKRHLQSKSVSYLRMIIS